jgi:hypothetical protein
MGGKRTFNQSLEVHESLFPVVLVELASVDCEGVGIIAIRVANGGAQWPLLPRAETNILR